MTVSLTGTGGLFTRLGKLGGWQLNVYGVIGTTAPSPSSAWGASGPSIKALGTAITDIDAQFFSAQQQVRDLLYATRDNVRSTLGGSVTAFTSLASSTLTTQVQDDAVLPSPSVETCIAELVRQMELSGSVVESNLTTVAVAADSNNNGTAQLVASLLQADGVRTERCYVEVGEIICTGSAQAGSATAGSEPLSVLGEPAVATTAYDWPKGSGGSGSLLLTNPTLDNSGGNLLTNSDFDDYTATNDPDNWALDTGTAGATIFSENSIIYRSGGKSLRFLGDGSQLTAVSQTFDDSTSGTAGRVYPLKVYAFNLFVRMSATPTGGILSVALVDGSGNPINDEAGAVNRVNKDLTSVSTSWVAVNGFFRTPRVLPSSVKIRLKLTTALESGRSLYMDDLAMTEATLMYQAGPYLAIFRGSTDLSVEDKWTVTTTNDVGGRFQTLFWRWFGASVKQLPTGSGYYFGGGDYWASSYWDSGYWGTGGSFTTIADTLVS